jgi:hypothetical protein
LDVIEKYGVGVASNDINFLAAFVIISKLFQKLKSHSIHFVLVVFCSVCGGGGRISNPKWRMGEAESDACRRRNGLSVHVTFMIWTVPE